MKLSGKKITLTPIRVMLMTVGGICAVLLALCLIFALHSGTALSQSAYEVAEKYVASVDREELLRLSREYLSGKLSPYEDGEAADASLEEFLKNGELTLSRAEDYSSSSPEFSLYVNGRYCFELTVKRKLLTFGGTKWKVKGISVPEDSDVASPLTLHVPKGATVTVNGEELERSDADPVRYYGLTELEESLSEEYYSESYFLGRFLAFPDVVVTLDGSRLTADTVENGTLRYPYPSSFVSGYTITVPYGSTVKVNGVTLDRSYLVDQGVTYPFLTRFEEDFTGLPTAMVYQLSSLFGEPDVVVTYGGSVLEDGGDMCYRLPEEMTETLTVLAPNYATVKLNGYTLSGGELTGSGIQLPIFEGVTSHAKTRPYLNEYTISGLLREGVLSAFDGNGKPLEISTYYSTPERIVFCCTRSSAMPDREKLTLRTFGREYVEYVYNGNNDLAANYKDITAMTPSASAAYYALHDLYKSLYNAPKYKSISVGNVEFIEYYPYTSTSMSVIMKVPFTATLNGVKYKFTVTMDVLYIYSGQIRRIVNYRILDTVSSAV